MKLLFIGDISGKPGRETVKNVLPNLKKEKSIDITVANCENAAGGRGVTMEVLNELMSYGIDFFTAGEHVWDIRDFREDLYEHNIPLVRPINYEVSDRLPGSGIKTFDLGKNGKLTLITLLGQTFMRDNVRNPFWYMDEIIEKYKSDIEDSICLVDFHAEATSEKVTLGYYLKNKVSALVGTHTHVGTVDTRLFDSTGFVTDVGMCGPYDASLWVKFEDIINNFKYPFKTTFNIEEEGTRVFNSVLLEFDTENTQFGIKKCKKIERIDKYLK